MHDSALAARYDALWNAAAPEVRAGRAALDAWAARKDDDHRRGVTLLARPSDSVTRELCALMDELRALEPDQYYHPPADLHITVLSLISATVDYEERMHQVDGFRAAVAEAVGRAAHFTIDAAGVTLSPAAVLARGFPRDDALERLRAGLRESLAARGLAGGLDARYRLRTAHTTMVRFTAPLRDPARFVDALQSARQRPFGATIVATLELTLSDWYQSAGRTRLLAAFPLPAAPPA
ncbi:hypothetical protein [Longimicrobium terrae]|uniref:2'-5' RNA ligase n=1 Tax=Longimicrobium terrae TaxID=1639882 RepID=A0A841H0V1_9BACT|nr:hypothetical protein [Longimicrobium terrae]MBB4637118.1 2'-5' RNA ligase [Longimicrobium terrae]MBB6071622.1 2'-5' RNA ligase [Longimicrobium terrae]NNC29962.1 hypothetical protein [Longimicrobium terrae]